MKRTYYYRCYADGVNRTFFHNKFKFGVTAGVDL